MGRGMAQLEAKMRDHVMEQEKVLAAEISDRQNEIKVRIFVIIAKLFLSSTKCNYYIMFIYWPDLQLFIPTL